MSYSRRMAVPDAHLLWLSAKTPNDQFLLYVFDGVPGAEPLAKALAEPLTEPLAEALAEVRGRAEGCDELRMRVRDECRWRYPRWVRGEVSEDQFLGHESVQAAFWQDCLGAVQQLATDQLDATAMTWRLHVLPATGRCIVVLQISHALGDGTRSAALAAALLGRPGPIPAVSAPDRGSLLLRSVAAARAYRQLVRDTEAGALPPGGPPRPPVSVNGRSALAPVLRALTVAREALPGPTVTVGALVVIGEALGGYLADRGEDVSALAAEVPMAQTRPPKINAHNTFRNVSVGLYPEIPRPVRAERIAADLAGQRRRSNHPATRASEAAFAAVPAALLRWGVRQFDPSARPASVAAHTVVSSVNRGPADLTFGGCPVTATAGFPALSPMMGLTHGVHGIGDTVTISVHADPGVVDVEDYLRRLASALTEGDKNPY